MSGAIPAWAVRGARVVFVDYAGPDRVGPAGYEVLPIPGPVYTIRDVTGECIRLEEIVNEPRWYGDIGFAECRFRIRAFRPAVPRVAEAEDVALFKHHLDQHQPVDA
jgi:hypothetical protein